MKKSSERAPGEIAASGRAGPSHGAAAPRATRVLGDLLLIAIFAGLIYLFLLKNGFIGNSDIQPYPY